MHFPRQKGERMGIDVKTHGDDLFLAAAYDASPVRARSEAQERASVLIAGRTLSVGNVLASENAPFYVAILSALADFRAGHEFEPLFEDVRDAVLGASPSQRQIDELNADLKQLEEVAQIPSREVLLGRLFGSMQSPIANFARVIKQIAEKDGEGEAAPAEAAAAE